MRTFGTFIGRRSKTSVDDDKVVAAEQIGAAEVPAPPEQDNQQKYTHLDSELFLPVARQLGEENESIRNLLIDAERKISELDAIKGAIGKLVEPVNEKLRNLEAVQSKLSAAEAKNAVLESDCAHLRESLSDTQQKVSALEFVNADKTKELAGRQAQISDLQGRVLQQGSEIEAARDETRRANERMALADTRAVQLESDSEAARQKLMASEQDRSTLQKSLDEAFDEMTQMSKRLLDAEKALAETQVRTQNSDQMLAEIQAERHRLAAALDEAKHQHLSEISSQKKDYEVLQARGALTETLLEDLRKSMRQRAEEIQSFDRRLSETLSPVGGGRRHGNGEELHPIVGSRSTEFPQTPAITSRDNRGSYPAPEKRGLWRSDFFDWIAGKFGP